MQTTFKDYPFYGLKTPSTRKALIHDLLIIVDYWENLTKRFEDMCIEKLLELSTNALKRDFEEYVS